jgi:hypothetical protein
VEGATIRVLVYVTEHTLDRAPDSLRAFVEKPAKVSVDHSPASAPQARPVLEPRNVAADPAAAQTVDQVQLEKQWRIRLAVVRPAERRFGSTAYGADGGEAVARNE